MSLSSSMRWWVLAALAAGIALRAHRLGDWDMWSDEVQTLWTSQSGEYIEGPMYRTAPINFLLTRQAVALLGPNEMGLRAVPFLCGSVTLALVFLLFRGWVGARAAALAMLAVSLSTWHIYWSQTGRHFALQTLLVLLALHGFLVFWRRGRARGLVAAALLLLAALFTHSSSGFYVVAFGAFVAASALRPEWGPAAREGGRGGARPGARRLAALATLALVLLVYLPTYLGVGSYLLENKTAWNPPWNIAGSLAYYVPPWLALPAAAGALLLLAEGSGLGALLALLAIVPALLVIAAAAATIASGAYCLPALVPIALLAGVACDRLLAWGTAAGRRAAAALLVAALFASQALECGLYLTASNGLKARWREACAFVRERRAPGDLFVASEGDVAQYYLGRENAAWFGRYEKEMGSDLFPPAGVTGVWYAIYAGESSILRPDQDAIRRILERARLVRLFPLHYGPKDRTIALFYERVGEAGGGAAGAEDPGGGAAGAAAAREPAGSAETK